MKPYRVLHVFNCFNQGGIENLVMNVYRRIDRNIIQFDFAFIDHKKGCFDDEVETLGGRIYYFDSEKKSISNYKKSLTRIIKENGPYIAIHSHIFYFSGFVLYVAKKCGIKVRISHSHDTQKEEKHNFIRKVYELFMRKLINLYATDKICCSDVAGKALFGKHGKYQVIYNGIDMNRFIYSNELRNKYRNELHINNKKVLLNVGRFADQKNHEFIIDVFNKVHSLRNDTVLLLIGSGPLEGMIREKINNYGLNNDVIILSNIKNTECYYNCADIFLLPSKYEGMAIVAIESQATGLYLLLSDVITREIAISDIIEYLPINTINNWVSRIITLLDKEYNRESYNKIFKESVFNIDTTISQLVKIYTSKIVLD